MPHREAREPSIRTSSHVLAMSNDRPLVGLCMRQWLGDMGCSYGSDMGARDSTLAAKRIVITGCIGAGKSWLARELGVVLGLPVVHLDRLWWEDGSYTIRGRRTATARAMAQPDYWALQRALVVEDRWIIDGGVDGLGIRLGRADTAIYLDLPLWLCAWRVLRRTGRPRTDYPPDVRESWTWTVSLVKWILWTYPRARRLQIESLLAEHVASANVICLRSARDVRDFLHTVAARRT